MCEYACIKCNVLLYRYIEGQKKNFLNFLIFETFWESSLVMYSGGAEAHNVIIWKWALGLRRAKPCVSLRPSRPRNDRTLVLCADAASAAGWALGAVCSSVCLFTKPVSSVLHADPLLWVMISESESTQLDAWSLQLDVWNLGICSSAADGC